MSRFIDEHRERFGVEPICDALQVAPSSYYALQSRPSSARERSDGALKPELERIHREHFSVYGVEKLWRQLRREGVEVGRDRVARLMCVFRRNPITHFGRIRSAISEFSITVREGSAAA